MKLRKRLENSNSLATVLAWFLAGYVWFCFVTTRWQVDGLDDLAERLKKGPVIYVLWHGRVMFGPSAWPGKLGQLFTLMDTSPIGRVATRTQAILGMKPIAMKENASNFAASRNVLQVIRKGHSIGIAADGPQGPQHNAKKAAIEWARASGCPVFVFAWSGKRVLQLNSWDRMLIPVPFSRGILVFRRWDVAVPRKLATADYEGLRLSLGARISEAEQIADAYTCLTRRS